MNRDILQNIIDNFDLQRLKRFFSEKNSKFRPSEESFDYYNTDNFSVGLKLGELVLDDGTLLVCAFEAKQELSERSGKKAQYELGKKILKETQTDAGIFIYYNQAGSFRFSLIYANYLGKKRDWSAFRRFTYFVSKDLTNKTFLQRIDNGDFSSLEKIKDAFSVEKVTKDFYESIANWYFWAVENSTFPNDNEGENGRNIAVIRLITRMIFIWFMRERGLVPKDLFEEKNITSIIKSISAQDSTYYTAILQNLFFATLSTKKDERKFRSEIRGYKGINPDQGNDSVFRYHELFKNSGKLKDYFGEIPFLNGGLFECLDDRKKGIYIDGFTAIKKNQPIVPNFLFFSPEKKVNLNKVYGTQNKKYHVHGLLDILSSFNFTIDENSPDDVDIALDPELLGRVFENLLASFNPETSTTARKATGSYYTPREIVNYMVVESLKAYFKTHLESIENIDEKLENLFSIASEQNPFDQKQSKKLVELIESVKIVDPAVGSGAFPMGALNKLVFILNKIDPGNELWKQAQLDAANTIPDRNLRDKTKKEIETYFKTKKPDYWRKLYLIQRCIYGVDIQQIAVEITKLRFFISLLVDEDKNDIQPLPNLDFKIMQGNSLLEEYEGIKLFDEKLFFRASKQEIIDKISGIDSQQKENDSRRLKFYEKNPHWMKKRNMEKPAELLTLENNNKVLNSEKVALYNELKNFEKTSLQTKLGFDGQLSSQSLGEELKRLHKEFFETSEKKEKDKLKEQIEKMEWDLIEATLKEQRKEAELKKLEKFKKSKSKPFFLWQLNFAEVFEKGGFDIVIANPPYIEISKREEKLFFQNNYKEILSGHYDLFIFFLKKGIDLLKEGGINAFITPHTFVIYSQFQNLRKWLYENNSIIEITDRIESIFETAVVDNSISIIAKGISIKKTKFSKYIYTGSEFKLKSQVQLYKNEYTPDAFEINTIQNRVTLKKYEINSAPLGDVVESSQGITVYAKVQGNKINYFREAKESINSRPYTKGREIFKYNLQWGKGYIEYGDWLWCPRDKKYFDSPKIFLRQTSADIIAAYVEKPFCAIDSVHSLIKKEDGLNLKYVLAIINSKLGNYLYHLLITEVGKVFAQVKLNFLRKIPIHKANEKQQKSFIEIVDKILAITKSSDYLENSSKKKEVKEYEKQIDQMVYKLYDLTTEEIEIVEGR